MGQSFTKGSLSDSNMPPLLDETQVFASWKLNDVKELWKRFQNQVFGYSLVETQFESIIAFKSDISKIVSIEDLFDVLDNDHDGRIDGLEIIGGITLCCQAPFEEKARFCFEVFDFNLNASLSEAELIMLLFSCICGLNLLTGGGEELEPDLETIEKLTKEAFIRADLNQDGLISFDEFIIWSRSNRELMSGLETLNRLAQSAKIDIDSDDSAEEFYPEELSDVEFNVYEVSNADTPNLSVDRSQWKLQVMEPTNVKKLQNELDSSSTNLSLIWGFGYKSRNSRNNLRYVGESNNLYSDIVVYHTASLAIVYDINKKSQSFYQGHKGQIMALAVHPSGRIVATADIKSSLHIWDSDSKNSICIIQGLVQNGIQHLEFSPSGDKIATVGLDPDHTVAIFDTASGDIISSAKGISSPNQVFDIAYSPNGHDIALVGSGIVKFYTGVHTSKRAIDNRVGKIGSIGKRQPFFCTTYLDEDCVVGCASGEVYRFHGYICIQVVQAHNFSEPVLCMYFNSFEGTLVTGGKDSLIKTWDSSLLEVGSTLDLSSDIELKFGSHRQKVEVISVQHGRSKVLVGTKEGNLYELKINSRSNGVTFLNFGWSHCMGELWGLAIHPQRDEFITCGDDKTIRLWSIRSKEQIMFRQMPEASRCVAFSPNGETVAIGLQDGSLSLMDMTSKDYKVFASWKHSKLALTSICFSEDGLYLALGSKDGNIYVYQSTDKRDFRRQAVCKGHTGSIICIDFSISSKYIFSNGVDGNAFFWDCMGNLIKNEEIIRNTSLRTNRCLYSWGSRGIWRNDCRNDDICSCMSLPDIGDILVGYKNGQINVFQYPTVSGSLFQSYFGHSGAVTNVCFTSNKRFAITVGGIDRTILIWKHDLEIGEDSDNENTFLVEMDSLDFRSEIADVGERSAFQEAVFQGKSSELLADIVVRDKLPGFDTVFPWKSIIVEPSHWVSASGGTDVDFSLTWVHGYRSHDCRNNVRYSASGSIVYITACVVVVYSKASGKQKFLQGAHKDEIIGLAPHPTGQVFATGEAGKNPSIIIWNAASMKIIHSINNCHARGVSLLSFNLRGNLLASIGMDCDNTLMVYDWSKKFELFRTPTDNKKILGLAFMSFNSSLINNEEKVDSRYLMVKDEVIITVGERSVKFWWSYGQNVVCQKGIWGSYKKEIVMCVASASPNVCVTGTFSGLLLVWKDFKLVSNSSLFREESASLHPVLCIWAISGVILDLNFESAEEVFDEIKQNYHQCCRYICGDASGNIEIWTMISSRNNDLDLICTKRFSISSMKHEVLSHSIRSVSERDGIILFGTKDSEIYEILDDSIPFLASSTSNEVSRNIPKKKICSAHFQGEVWGLATHPDSPLFFTSGDDRILRCWSLEDHSLIFFSLLPEKSRALNICSLDGSLMAIGFNNGDIWSVSIGSFFSKYGKRGLVSLEGCEIPISLGNTGDGLLCTSLPAGPTQWIQTLRFSFDKTFLAAGCHDKNIYLYPIQVNGDYGSPILLCGHSGFVSHIDFGVKLAGRTEIIDSSAQKSNSSEFINISWEVFDEKKKQIVSIVSNRVRVFDGGFIKESIVSEKKDSRDLTAADVVIQSSSGAYELFYWNLDGSRIYSSSSMKDVWWITWSCPFGWPVQGIWPNRNDGISVLSVCRSHSWNTVPVLACSTDFGHVRLFNYPCDSPGSPYKSYRGHASNIANIEFSYDDKYCITVGGADRSIFVWETDIQDEIRERKSVFGEIMNSFEEGGLEEFKSGHSAIIQDREDLENFRIGTMATSTRDGILSMKPWKSNVREPSNWKESRKVDQDPRVTMELKYVYGYRGWDCRNNIGFAQNRSQIVYPVASVGIVLNSDSNSQVHNIEHDDDIIALSVHPEGHIVATGEIGNHPKIVIWDTNTGITIRVIYFHSKGVSHLMFSGSGVMLVSCGLDNDRTIAVHNIQSGALLGTGKAGCNIDIFGISVNNDNTFCTVGKNHIKFWDFPSHLSASAELSSKTGIFSHKNPGSKTCISCAYLGSDAITGMIDGYLLQWKGRICSKWKIAHQGPITAMCSVPFTGAGSLGQSDSGPQVVSGGKDGMLFVWNSQLEKLWSMNIAEMTPRSLCPQVQSLAAKENRIIFGTKASEIYQVNLLSVSDIDRLVQGHFEDRAEICGLSIHPLLKRFVTCADDHTVRVWDAKNHRQIFIAKLDSKGKALDYSADGSQIAIGTVDGRLIVLSSDLSFEIINISINGGSIESMKFSPNGELLAVGCLDGMIYVLDTTSYCCRCQCFDIFVPVTGIDFSSDSQIIQVCNGAESLSYWDIDGNRLGSSLDIRDIEWSTFSCIIGWPVQGCWKFGSKGVSITSADRSADGKYLVCADDRRLIKLYDYPCVEESARYLVSKGHSEPIAEVRFSWDGEEVYSIGGLDKSILQFSIKK